MRREKKRGNKLQGHPYDWNRTLISKVSEHRKSGVKSSMTPESIFACITMIYALSRTKAEESGINQAPIVSWHNATSQEFQTIHQTR